MKKLLILFVLVIYSCEDSTVINFNEEKEFFEERGNLLLYKDNPFNGIVEVYFDNGQINLKSTYKNGYKDGLNQEYYDNGQLFKKVSYKEGHRDLEGLYEEYYKNGQLVKIDEFGDPIVNYESNSENFQIIDGRIYLNGSLFSGTLNSSFKKDKGIFEYEDRISQGQVSQSPGMFFSKTSNSNDPIVNPYDFKFVFDVRWKNFLSLVKQKGISKKDESILIHSVYKSYDEYTTEKIGELRFNPKKNEVILLTLMDNKPFSGKVLKNKIVSHFSEYIDSSNKIRYDLDGEFIFYHDNGIIKYKGEYSKGSLDEGFLIYDNKGELITPVKKSNGKINESDNCESSVRFHIQNLNMILQYIDYNGNFYYGEFFDPQYGKNFFFTISVDGNCNIINVDI